MATIPLWAVGRNLTLVQLTPQTANATTGVLTPGTTTIITGLVDELDPEEQITTEEISPITSPRENHVALMSGTRLRVAEILTPQTSIYSTAGPQLPILRTTLLVVGICRVQWTHGGNSWDYMGLYERSNGPFRGKGKQLFTMSFLPVDPGTNNLVYS